MTAGDNQEENSPIRSDGPFAERMRREIHDWRSEGLITSEMALILSLRYPEGEVDRRLFNLSRLSGAIAILGAILVGVGIISVLAANWQHISDVVKIGLMVVVTSSAYAMGGFLAFREGYTRTGIALILLGAILYGASIHLIAQAFNIEVNHPVLVPAWFLGVAPLAYITRSRAVLAFSLILLLASLGFRAQVWFANEPGPDAGNERFLLGVLLFMIVSAALFALGRLQARIPGLDHFARIFDVFSIVASAVGGYLLSFRVAWDEVGRFKFSIAAPEFWITAGGALAVAAAALWMGYLRRPRIDEEISRRLWEFAGVATIVGVAALSLIALLLSASWFWFAMNLIILGAIIAMLNAGTRFNRDYLVNIAFALFSITVITRYFEIGYSLLASAAGFIVTGVLLIVMGFGLERWRRRLLRDMRQKASRP